MAHLTIGILNGDDIGHEIVPASVRIAKAAAARTGLAIDWRPMPIGHSALDTLGTTMPEDTLDKLSVLDGFILGPIGHRAYPKVPGAINPHPILRKHFGLFANVRPTRSYPGIGGLFDDVDLIIVRENNEGFQPDRNVVAGSGEFRPTHDTTISVRVITRAGSYRVAKAALEPCWGGLAHGFHSTGMMLRRFGGHPAFAINFDPSHFALARDDLSFVVAELAPYIRHVHIKDVAGRPGLEGRDFIFPLIGEGLVSWEEVFSALDRAGFRGFMSVEFESYRYYRTVLKSDPARASKLSMEQLRALEDLLPEGLRA